MITGLYTLGSLSVDSVSTRNTASRLVALKSEFDDLNRQLTTGKKSDDFAGLGSAAWKSVSFDKTLTALDGYDSAVASTTTRVKTYDTILSSIAKNGSDVSTALTTGGYTVGTDGKVTAQADAETRFAAIVSMLNSDITGKRLFGGAKDGSDPVETVDRILNGYTDNGTTYDGLRTVVSERVNADVHGGDGRLQATNTSGTSVVTLAHDPSTWGFTISGATGSAGIAASGSGPVTFTVNPQPADGETVSVQLGMPDGTSTTLKLVARTTAGTGPAGEDSFVIGATTAATAANLQAALQTVIGRTATTSLSAASTAEAAQEFFVNPPPTRVSTTSNSVQWYIGGGAGAATSARSTVQALIGDGMTVSVGAQANETGPAQMMAAFGALACATFSTAVPTDQQRWTELSQRVKTLFSQAGSGIDTIRRDMGTAIQAITAQKDQNAATRAAVLDMKSSILDVSNEEVSVKLLSVQNQLQASYQVTSMLSKLSLVNYMG
jgi:flagellar hook-associated protein 3 FlgL